jgi:hypothetical protein
MHRTVGLMPAVRLFQIPNGVSSVVDGVNGSGRSGPSGAANEADLRP